MVAATSMQLASAQLPGRETVFVKRISQETVLAIVLVLIHVMWAMEGVVTELFVNKLDRTKGRASAGSFTLVMVSHVLVIYQRL